MGNILGGKKDLTRGVEWERGLAVVKAERAARLARVEAEQRMLEALSKLREATNDYSSALDNLEKSFLAKPFQGRDFSRISVPVKRASK